MATPVLANVPKFDSEPVFNVRFPLELKLLPLPKVTLEAVSVAIPVIKCEPVIASVPLPALRFTFVALIEPAPLRLKLLLPVILILFVACIEPLLLSESSVKFKSPLLLRVAPLPSWSTGPAWFELTFMKTRDAAPPVNCAMPPMIICVVVLAAVSARLIAFVA